MWLKGTVRKGRRFYGLRPTAGSVTSWGELTTLRGHTSGRSGTTTSLRFGVVRFKKRSPTKELEDEWKNLQLDVADGGP